MEDSWDAADILQTSTGEPLDMPLEEADEGLADGREWSADAQALDQALEYSDMLQAEAGKPPGLAEAQETQQSKSTAPSGPGAPDAISYGDDFA